MCQVEPDCQCGVYPSTLPDRHLLFDFDGTIVMHYGISVKRLGRLFSLCRTVHPSVSTSDPDSIPSLVIDYNSPYGTCNVLSNGVKWDGGRRDGLGLGPYGKVDPDGVARLV